MAAFTAVIWPIPPGGEIRIRLLGLLFVFMDKVFDDEEEDVDSEGVVEWSLSA